MIFYFFIWNILYYIINIFQKYFNYFFFKYNKTNLFYNNKYNILAFFEVYFLSVFFNIKNFSNYYFYFIINYRFKKTPIFLVFNINTQKNIESLKYNKKNKFYKFFIKINFIKINFIEFNLILTTILKFYNEFFKYKYYKQLNKSIKFIFLVYLYLNYNKNFNNIGNLNLINYYFTFFKILNNNKIKFKKFNKLSFNFKKISKKKNNYKINLFYLNNKLKKLFFINYPVSNVSKYLSRGFFNLMYLRKNKIFNKGRYSRNRQLYRTGVYWCLWVNIILIYSLYFLFYRFSFNFGYIWFGLFVFIYSTIFSRILKYNFINVKSILKELKNLIIWLGYINKFFYFSVIKFIITFLNYINFNNVINSKILLLFNSIHIKILNIIYLLFFKYKIFYFTKIVPNYGITFLDKYFLNYIKFFYNVIK